LPPVVGVEAALRPPHETTRRPEQAARPADRQHVGATDP
jgi:hypothetical protein